MTKNGFTKTVKFDIAVEELDRYRGNRQNKLNGVLYY